ncbi:DUF58 domain-containing protein [Paracoccus onubensis]|uniref:DUF58 domain-containing protein n=1 Tax=Paracoccus onubensis TaxID=1675788 RepID=A0A418SMH9_9RHOB|nr:DUF58 domain-containing protein [Paracoccus onubensis]RJE82144.1 DUF58 domain-containing protein [Paracoccus onubensis]
MRPSRLLVILGVVASAASLSVGLFSPDNGIYAFALWFILAMAGALDLLISPAPRRFTIKADLPQRGFVGTMVALDVEIAAMKGQLPADMQLRISHDDHIVPESETLTIRPDAGAGRMKISLPLGLRARGNSRIERLWLRFPSRLQLFEIMPSRPLDLDIRIQPDIQPVLNGEIQTRLLPLTDGLKSMQIRGQGSEFHQLREFQSDMDPRMIDWKRSARRRELIARETRAERNHQIVLCLDSGHLMGEQIGGVSRFDRAFNAALALAWAGGLGGDNVGFYNFGSRPGRFLPPRPGRNAFNLIQSEGADLFPEEAETNHTLGLSHLNGVLSRRSLVVVFSEFADSETVQLMVENLAVISRQHLVLYVAFREPDIETLAQPESTGMDDVALAVAARQFRQERQSVYDRLNRLGVLCLDTAPEDLTAGLISRYVDIKAQELI